MYAADNHIDVNVISLLLEKGADINKNNRKMEIALGIALQQLNIEYNYATIKCDKVG